ncbi:MAG: hypothetical protein OEN21_18705 [Myxococcales bacterium]|nr:hypothetical protein [Myxococcales bacterium]
MAAGCGDSNEPSAADREVAVTVFAPSGGISVVDGSLPQLTWSLEYQVGCGDTSNDSFTAQGTLEPVDGFLLVTDGPAAIWNGMVEFEPGPCAIQLRARDTDGEVVCTYTETITFDFQLPSEAYFNMICYATCPTISFPGAETVPKTSCAPVGGLIVSAETLGDGVMNVRYTIEHTNLLDNNADFANVYEGELQLAGLGTVDLGDGPVPTNTWEAIVGEVIAGEPHALELTALDADGTPLCSAETSFEVISGGIAQVHVVLPCGN